MRPSFRCDTTDVRQTELEKVFAITVNCYLQLRVLQSEVPCSFRSFRHRIVSMYNRRGPDELFGHQASTFFAVESTQGFHPWSRTSSHVPMRFFDRQQASTCIEHHFDHAGNDELCYMCNLSCSFCLYCYELWMVTFCCCFGLFWSQQR